MKDISGYMQEAHYASTAVVLCKCKLCHCGGEVPFITDSEVCSLCRAGKHARSHPPCYCGRYHSPKCDELPDGDDPNEEFYGSRS